MAPCLDYKDLFFCSFHSISEIQFAYLEMQRKFLDINEFLKKESTMMLREVLLEKLLKLSYAVT